MTILSSLPSSSQKDEVSPVILMKIDGEDF